MNAMHPVLLSSDPLLLGTWILVFKAGVWEDYLKAVKETATARGSRGRCRQPEMMCFTRSSALLGCLLHTKPFHSTHYSYKQGPVSSDIPSFQHLCNCSEPSRSPEAKSQSHFQALTMAKKRKKSCVIYSFIILQFMESHLLTWLTCLDLITTHS